MKSRNGDGKIQRERNRERERYLSAMEERRDAEKIPRREGNRRRANSLNCA